MHIHEKICMLSRQTIGSPYLCIYLYLLPIPHFVLKFSILLWSGYSILQMSPKRHYQCGLPSLLPSICVMLRWLHSICFSWHGLFRSQSEPSYRSTGNSPRAYKFKWKRLVLWVSIFSSLSGDLGIEVTNDFKQENNLTKRNWAWADQIMAIVIPWSLVWLPTDFCTFTNILKCLNIQKNPLYILLIIDMGCCDKNMIWVY